MNGELVDGRANDDGHDEGDPVGGRNTRDAVAKEDGRPNASGQGPLPHQHEPTQHEEEVDARGAQAGGGMEAAEGVTTDGERG